MPLTLHPLARTTPRVRAELRAADPTLTDAALARRYGLAPPTVNKWRQRESTADRSHRPRGRRRGGAAIGCVCATDLAGK